MLEKRGQEFLNDYSYDDRETSHYPGKIFRDHGYYQQRIKEPDLNSFQRRTYGSERIIRYVSSEFVSAIPATEINWVTVRASNGMTNLRAVVMANLWLLVETRKRRSRFFHLPSSISSLTDRANSLIESSCEIDYRVSQRERDAVCD